MKLLKIPPQKFDFLAFEELVGHSTLSMTLRYMPLAPSALCEAIGVLNFGQPVRSTQSAAL